MKNEGAKKKEVGKLSIQQIQKVPSIPFQSENDFTLHFENISRLCSLSASHKAQASKKLLQLPAL